MAPLPPVVADSDVTNPRLRGLGRLRGRVALVTGGSRGIGRAIALALAREAAKVAICARTWEQVREATRELEGLSDAMGVPADVTSAVEVEALLEAVREKFGPPDVLVNCAGSVVRKRLEDMSDGEWAQVLASNLTSVFHLTREVLPDMRANRRGRIVNISSIAGRQGTRELAAYCAAKHGVIGLTRALALELHGSGIQVNAVCPGSVDTAMLRQGMGAAAKADMMPADVARAVLYLVVDAPDAMTGQCLDVYPAGNPRDTP